ncbi:ubiquitin-specific protease otu1 [Rhodotorula toruloides]
MAIPPARQELRHGYPPKLLDPNTPSESTLKSLGITSGEAFVVSEGSAEPAASTSSFTASSSQPRAVSSSVVPSPAPTRAQQPIARPKPEAAGSGGQYVETGGGFLCLRVIPDDNSCLFRAVGLVLNPGEAETATALRRVVAGAIQADPETYSEAMLGRTPEEYVATILKPTSWGGAIELAIFAKHFSTEICSIDVQTGRVDRFGQDAGYDNFVMLVYSGIHYDALTFSFAPPEASTSFPPPNIDFDTTVFPRTEEHLLSAASELVAQLRAQHAYTDTATFALRCGVCREALKGEKEARQHAEQTGHTSFTEYDG